MSRNNTLNRLRQVHPIEDLFFKRRTIFGVNSSEYQLRDPNHNSHEISRYTGVTNANELDDAARQFLHHYINEGTVTRRFQLKNCSLHLARETSSYEPSGFYWSVHAKKSDVWHDSFRVPPGSGLVFNAFVEPSHRRQGVYRLLQSSSHDHLLGEVGCNRVFTIVEDRNEASMRANRKFGLTKKGKNYLIKFLSVNIISVIETPNGRRTHFVLPRGGL